MAATEIDSNLLKRCIAEEPGAWKDFVDRFIGLFVHVIHHSAQARSIRLSQDDIDDLCADVFLQIVANDYAVLRKYRRRSSLPTYLSVVARRVVVRSMANRRMAEAFGHVQAHQSSLDHAQAGAPEQQRIDDRDEIKKLLKELPAMDAAVVKQFHLEGRSYREISNRLGIAENSIGPTLTRAREKMRSRQSGS